MFGPPRELIGAANNMYLVYDARPRAPKPLLRFVRRGDKSSLPTPSDARNRRGNETRLRACDFCRSKGCSVPSELPTRHIDNSATAGVTILKTPQTLLLDSKPADGVNHLFMSC